MSTKQANRQTSRRIMLFSVEQSRLARSGLGTAGAIATRPVTTALALSGFWRTNLQVGILSQVVAANCLWIRAVLQFMCSLLCCAEWLFLKEKATWQAWFRGIAIGESL